MHCSHKNIIQVSDKASMPLAAVFSREVINNQAPQQREDIFPLSLGLWAARESCLSRLVTQSLV